MKHRFGNRIHSDSSNRRSYICILLFLQIAGGLLPASAKSLDLDRPTAFDITAQPIDAALISLSNQAGVQIVIAPSLDGSQSFPGVTGIVSPRTALNSILANSGFEYSTVGSS